MRCAIYTRKSTEEGLDQEFNSLDAQHEAAIAFIRSQRHEGWKAHSSRYDDGGYSGADLNRPALTRLLSDVRAGKLDCVVVYKVDRLTRSLKDFVKLMSEFEEHGVTFVSVTQQFNTTTSMGRLTLNILLSFAQFERELISERTRDKIAFARRNGKWGGGRPAIGYRMAPNRGHLEPDPETAPYIRAIFAIYLATGSLRRTAQQLQSDFPDKPWLAPARIQALLRRPIYVGKIVHRGEIFDGRHVPLVEQSTWDAVQAQLNENRVNHSSRRQRYQALLHDVLRCGHCGGPMQHSMTAKAGIRYRYYCCPHTDHEGRSAGSGRSVPAAALESFVIRQLQQLYQEQHLESRVLEDVQTEIPSRVHKGAVLRDWNRLGPAQKRYLCESVIERLEHHTTDGVIVLRLQKDSHYGRGTAMADEHRIPFHVRVGRYGKKRFVRGPSPVTPVATHGRVPLVSRLLALAIHFNELRHQGAVENQTEMASVGRVTRARVSQIMNLVNLAPSIQEQILLWPRVSSGRDPFVLRELLPICTTADWSIQLDLWHNLLASRLG